ncbi:SDR family NAD(P)-dependent oxidoreductase [Gordonia sp. zg691]|uniref:SDR family oxidoreductase n=1 Tax=Gordonia jinghuaiqii TaxID=2758710 RepID=UPI001662745A|nr:SDR family oxidoreductase [Gordonia jinghuaiqii]MBD0859783.1 SDR family NAD(P)-dependent oxidoreductase [Gordonia jinghuaiqii]
MGYLDGKTVIVTGAGRGIGREHAVLLAQEGARVVVNDLGGASNGSGSEAGPAHDVVATIRAAGGEAVASVDDVADEEGAIRVVQTAVESFGDVHGLVNNAGVLRDRVLVNLSAEDWDVVVRVNLRGTFLMTRAVANHWRTQSKSGLPVSASVINTSSESGVFGNPGQANYAAAKAGVASLTQVSAKELSRYGVRVNAILPQARTRLTEGAFGEALAPKPGEFDRWSPANISPFVAYLASDASTITGEVFLVGGSRVQRIRSWQEDPDWKLSTDGRWTVSGIDAIVSDIGVPENVNTWSASV